MAIASLLAEWTTKAMTESFEICQDEEDKYYNRGQLLREGKEKSPVVGVMWVLSLARAPRPWRGMNSLDWIHLGSAWGGR
jgi:hypothetical protein